jgi:hypothetical protein
MAIFTFLGAAAATAIGLGATAASVISAGLALAAQFALSYFTRQKQKGGQAREKRVAISGSIQFGADVPAWTVYGTTALVGHRVYYGYWGTGDEYNAEVFVLANGRCEGLVNKVFFYGQEHTLVSATVLDDEDEHWKVDGFGDLISIRFYAGRSDQAVDSKLVTDTASLDNNWKSTSTLTGMAYVVVERKFDVDKFSDGRPEFKFVLKGLRCYDWRKDTTVSGGSGSHRVDDPSTWEYTSNPAICRANYELGLKGLESDRAIIGIGKSFNELHLASYTAAANACDVDRTKNARTFKTYQIGMIVDSEEDFTEVLRDFDDSMAGYSFNASGLSGVIAGYAQTPAFTITDNDIRMDASKTRRNRRPTTELYNHLGGSFTSPESFYNPEPLTVVTVAGDVTADKRLKSLSYDFTQVNDPDVAQYLLNIRYRQMRLGGFAKLPVTNRLAFQVEGGDWVTYDSKTWIVMGRKPDADGYVLELAETASSVYSETGIAVGPVVTAPSAPVFFEQSTVSNLAVQAYVVSGAADQPGIKVSWDAVTDPRVDAVIIEYRIVGETEVQRVRDDSPGDGEIVIAPLNPSSDYEVRATIATTPGRPATFTPWTSVTTSAVTFGLIDSSVSLAKLNLDVQGILAEQNRLRADVLAMADAVLDSTSAGTSIEMIERYQQGQRLQALVAQSEGRSSALVATEQQVRADADSALASDLTALEATVNDDVTAAIAAEQTTRANAISALASDTLLVKATADLGEATGLMALESEVSGDGLTTSFGVLLRAETSDDFEEAGMTFEIVSDGGDPATLTSSIKMKADSFRFDNGFQPFAITANGTFLKDVYFERLRSSPAITAYSIDINALNGSISLTTT